MSRTQATGARAEASAADYLRTKGFRVLKQNVRTPYGEIDLLCQDGSTLVFVEVRYRRSTQFGEPEETTVGRKMQRMRQSAEWYVSQQKVEGDYRIDVIGMAGDPPAFTHIHDAQ